MLGYELIFLQPPNGLINGTMPLDPQNTCLYMDNQSFFNIHTEYQNKLREVAETQNVDIISLQHEFEERGDAKLFFSDYRIDAVHPNQPGRDICTEVIARHIIDSLKK
jgi:hypothetical protein